VHGNGAFFYAQDVHAVTIISHVSSHEKRTSQHVQQIAFLAWLNHQKKMLTKEVMQMPPNKSNGHISLSSRHLSSLIG